MTRNQYSSSILITNFLPNVKLSPPNIDFHKFPQMNFSKYCKVVLLFFHYYFNFFDSHLLQVTNVAETLGLGKKTPMGIFLDEFGIEPEVKYM